MEQFYNLGLEKCCLIKINNPKFKKMDRFDYIKM